MVCLPCLQPLRHELFAVFDRIASSVACHRVRFAQLSTSLCPQETVVSFDIAIDSR